MKLPLSWISLYSDITSVIAQKSSKEIAHIFSTHTAEVEGVETCFADKVVIGKVITCEKHPESKKLSIVRVNVGQSEVTILTGAPNIVDAHYVAVALVGAVLHGDFTIGERMMAGMMSSGMICGMDEVGLTTDPQTGIMILETYWSEAFLASMIGESFYHLTLPFPGIHGKEFSYRLHDAIFEIDNKSLTNRPDLFSVRGNAREFHALFETPFADTTFSLDTENLPSLEARVETPLCTSYHLLACDTITVGQSPLSLSLMMERAGLLPKLDIVDITNMVMVEW
jgi:phenylalanyl-tRNA synthetase beta chain